MEFCNEVHLKSYVNTFTAIYRESISYHIVYKIYLNRSCSHVYIYVYISMCFLCIYSQQNADATFVGSKIIWTHTAFEQTKKILNKMIVPDCRIQSDVGTRYTYHLYETVVAWYAKLIKYIFGAQLLMFCCRRSDPATSTIWHMKNYFTRSAIKKKQSYRVFNLN